MQLKTFSIKNSKILRIFHICAIVQMQVDSKMYEERSLQLLNLIYNKNKCNNTILINPIDLISENTDVHYYALHKSKVEVIQNFIFGYHSIIVITVTSPHVHNAYIHYSNMN